MIRSLLIILFLILTAFSCSAQSPQPPAGFEGDAYNATLALYGTFHGVTHFVCTIQPYEKIPGGYHLISAGHCVQKIPAGMQFSVANQIGGPLTPVTMLKAYFGGGLDFSEFELKTDAVYTVLELGTETEEYVGAPIINVNFAAGLVKQFGFGFIASERMPESEHCDIDTCVGDYMVQIYGTGGSSGSAVISARTHKIIGITVGSFGVPIGLGVEPISWFKKFLAGPNQPHPAEGK